MTKKIMTTAAGAPIGNNQHSLTAGPRGPVLMQDVQLIEKMAHFNRERIPERVVHAKGAGAYGTLTITHDITRYTKAAVFSQVGKKTGLFSRFSKVVGEKGSADTERDPRGFAVKFYTDQGNWDLVGNNTPVFFERDPLKFSDFIHSQKREPRTGYKDPRRMWDYWAKSPQALHQVTILFSDRGIPDGHRFMHGFGSHTFSFINSKDERFWVKFHFRSTQGIKNLTSAKSAELAGTDPDYSTRDLFEAIEAGHFPQWALKVQVMPERDAEKYPVNPFDLTKIWKHKDYPLMDVGVMELNRNPENYFAEVEQAAFSPSNVVPGIGFSPDKMLQARLLSYPDAHRYRLGVNYQSLPVNRPLVTTRTYHRDGAMRFDGNSGREDNYEPNGFDGPTDDALYLEPPLKISGDADRYNANQGNDDFTQAGDLYRLMPQEEKDRLTTALADSMKDVPKETLKINVSHFEKCDPEYGKSVGQKAGL